jgi:tetrathionate reductase subunit B
MEKFKDNQFSRRKLLKTAGIAAGATLLAVSSPASATNFSKAFNSKQHPRWGFMIDLDNCIGCKACAVACKTEFEVPLGVFRSSVKELDEGTFPNVKRSHLPWLCNHCENPVCISDCPVDEVEAKFAWPDGTVEKYMKRATYKRPDGIVLVDKHRCVGCGACVDLCPYEVRFLNPAKKTTSLDAVSDHPADKCTLCQHRLDAGLVPACVNTCQANARIIGDLNDPNSNISKLLKKKKTNVLLPSEGTNPKCSYVALNPKTFTEGRDTKDE